MHEGLSENITDFINNDSRLIHFFADIGCIPIDNSVGSIDSCFLFENIMCFTALMYDDEKGKILPPDPKMGRFNDSENGAAIIIFNVQEFVKRIAKTLNEVLGGEFWFSYGLVDYSYEINKSMQVDEFTKNISYNYQNEFRIAINLGDKIIKILKDSGSNYNNDGSLELYIGDISDIARILSVNDYLHLDSVKSLDNILFHKPKYLRNFYPPVKGKISYIFPIINFKDKTLISPVALYPSIRDENTYYINVSRLDLIQNSFVQSNDFFNQMLDIYIKSIADIFKCNNNIDQLKIFLIAVAEFMKLNGIHKCGGIEIGFNENAKELTYLDFSIHNQHIINKENYNCFTPQSIYNHITDAAILMALTDQKVLDEYEYQGKKYVRFVVSRTGKLTDGRIVSPGEIIWVEVSKLYWFY